MPDTKQQHAAPPIIIRHTAFSAARGGPTAKTSTKSNEKESKTDLQLDVVVLLLGATLEHVERRTLRHVQHRSELELTFHGEVLYRGVVLSWSKMRGGKKITIAFRRGSGRLCAVQSLYGEERGRG